MGHGNKAYIRRIINHFPATPQWYHRLLFKGDRVSFTVFSIQIMRMTCAFVDGHCIGLSRCTSSEGYTRFYWSSGCMDPVLDILSPHSSLPSFNSLRMCFFYVESWNSHHRRIMAGEVKEWNVTGKWADQMPSHIWMTLIIKDRSPDGRQSTNHLLSLYTVQIQSKGWPGRD